MVTSTQTKMVTGKINGQEVTAPSGTSVLEAAKMAGIEIPNLCFQPKMRAWGSCRICTVEFLGKRGGLDISCSTPLAEGMEVLTHSPAVGEARQFILQNYLIDHALDCPTCDKSGECYLQDNTYLHNVNANPYRRPKFAKPYEHFSDTIDYKWDRCILCNRCTRVCDEIIGVTAIECANRGLEATIVTGFGKDLSETTCTNCSMCIAVCPVGAFTDRKFGHHPWELDTTETICGYCDVGCTINVESNKGVVRRTTNLWERGVNFGYVCDEGRWGHEHLQHPARIAYPRVRGDQGNYYEVDWDEAIDEAAERLAHFQGGQFAALASGENTNEEAYALQQFTRAVMRSNSIDRVMSPPQMAAERALINSLGVNVSHTNSMQELFTDVRSILVVGPNIFAASPITSYWINHARHYREARIVVISNDWYPLCDRAVLWLQPKPETTPLLLQAIAEEIGRLGLHAGNAPEGDHAAEWYRSVKDLDLRQVAEQTGVPADAITRAAVVFATGRDDGDTTRPEGGFPPGVIYNTAARQGAELLPAPYRSTPDGTMQQQYGDAEAITEACANLMLLTGNLGRPGGGLATPRGAANFQGAIDMGCVPYLLPGGQDATDPLYAKRFADAWLNRWAERALTSNGFVPVTDLPTEKGLGAADLAEAIEAGTVKALFVEGSIWERDELPDKRLQAALPKLELLIVVAPFDSPLTEYAHVVFPAAVNLEKDGTFTSFDRTVQRVRAAVPTYALSRSNLEIISLLSRRMGYGMNYAHPTQVMSEINTLVPGYAGVTYARLERGGIVTPVGKAAGSSETILGQGDDSMMPVDARMMPARR